MRIVGVILLILAAGLASLLLWEARHETRDFLRSSETTVATTGTMSPSIDDTKGSVTISNNGADDRLATRLNNELAKLKEKGRQIEQLPKGNIVLDGPKAMKLGEIRTVHANVGFNVPIDKLRERVSPGSQTREDVLAVSRDMIAVLNGAGFKITAVSPEQQSVAEGFPTVWSWNVEAKETGDQELEATLYVLVDDSRQRINSYTQKISVSVRELTWGEWLKSFRDGFDAVKAIVLGLGSAVTAVAGWLLLYLDRRRTKALTPVP